MCPISPMLFFAEKTEKYRFLSSIQAAPLVTLAKRCQKVSKELKRSPFVTFCSK